LSKDGGFGILHQAAKCGSILPTMLACGLIAFAAFLAIS
jgi:hypothetical protein